jgi:hypothetical protein
MKKCSDGGHFACGVCLKKASIEAYEAKYGKYT